jgi:hypothetical protein
MNRIHRQKEDGGRNMSDDEEDNAAFFSEGYHMHSLELRIKIAELLEKE